MPQNPPFPEQNNGIVVDDLQGFVANHHGSINFGAGDLCVDKQTRFPGAVWVVDQNARRNGLIATLAKWRNIDDIPSAVWLESRLKMRTFCPD